MRNFLLEFLNRFTLFDTKICSWYLWNFHLFNVKHCNLFTTSWENCAGHPPQLVGSASSMFYFSLCLVMKFFFFFFFNNFTQNSWVAIDNQKQDDQNVSIPSLFTKSGLLIFNTVKSKLWKKWCSNFLIELLVMICTVLMYKFRSLIVVRFQILQIFELLESSLLDESMKNNNEVVFSQISALLYRWQTLESTSSLYSVIVEECWKHFTEVCKKPFVPPILDEWKLLNQLKLLQHLKQSFFKECKSTKVSAFIW